MKALLLSAYDAESHRLWRGSIKAMFPLTQWSELTLPARYFPWRVRGNSLSWAFNHRELLSDNYDFLLTTSMTDLSALRGFVPALAQIPTAVYCHENQFAYPENSRPGAARSNPIEPQILSIYTALCADQLVFNSHYNRRTFLDGASALLAKLPDHVPAGLSERLQEATVIPVPLSQEIVNSRISRTNDEADILTMVWNHRWEYDKGPALLLAIVQQLIEQKTRFRLHLLGQRFRQEPPEFELLGQLLQQHYDAHNISPGHSGYVADRAEYCRVLAGADVVLSTALHDFQGLSVLEAVTLGCTPLTPAALVYPEYLPPDCMYSILENDKKTALNAVGMLQLWATQKATSEALPRVSTERFYPISLISAYAQLIRKLTK